MARIPSPTGEKAMGTVTIERSGGGKASVDQAVVDEFARALGGTLLRPGNEGYDESRTLWNAMIDRRPALVARCTDAADVGRAVDFAREHGLLLSVRGGGHNIAGNAVCEAGLMIDLSGMRAVRVDRAAKRAHVEPGATLGDLDGATQAFGLATPLGINSTTGVAGLTLGGGFGWLSRRHGMTVDNLVAADVVTADGRLVHASVEEHPDLFWALRGGGGNFGVVTRFEFALHPVGPDVYAGLVVFPLAQAVEALRKYRAYVDDLGDDTSVWAVLRKAPPLPFLPERAHGQEVVVFAAFHAGDQASGERAIGPVRRFGEPLGEHLGMQPFVQWQTAFDPLLEPGARNYWKSLNFTELSDETIGVVTTYADRLPTPQTEIFIGLLGGQVSRVPKDATAYAQRDAKFVMNVHGRWEKPADDSRCVAWAREFFQEATPYAAAGVYVNFLTDDEPAERIRAAYGASYDRLVEVKRRYDPKNLFRMNQNIRP
jgi:FAD/FMN-containing dehydrogenase